MRGVADQIDSWLQTGIGPGQTILTKTFVVNHWGQKIVLIRATAQVTVSILYTLNAEIPPSDSEFYPLTVAAGVTLLPNKIIPFGVEDPVHFIKVEVVTGAAASTDVFISVFGSR